jgi:methyl-accepting chemotaxis protein
MKNQWEKWILAPLTDAFCFGSLVFGKCIKRKGKSGGKRMKLSVGKKIGGGFLVLLVLLSLVAAVSTVMTGSAQKNLDNVDVRVQRISLDYQIKNSFQGAAMAIRGYMLYRDDKFLAQYTDYINATKKFLSERINNSSEESRPVFEKTLQQVKDYDHSFMDLTLPLLKENKPQEAMAIAVTVAPITAEINKTVESKIQENEQKSKDVIAKTHGELANSRGVIITFGVIALLAGAILAFFITRAITRPVGIMIKGVKHLAEGDFTSEIIVKTSDEIGELAWAVNQTRGQLKILIGDIAGIAQNLAAHSQELAASAEEVSATVEEVASTTGQVAAMAEKSMENANVTAGESRKVVEVAGAGGATVRETVDKINSIAGSVGKVNVSIQDLGELSAKIGNIIDVITGIADQTNLLALNAAIEAARAGDQGRGFAVVAEEVRQLAEQSAGAAREIGQLVTKIQTGVEVAVKAMESGAAEVEEGVRLASGAGAALEDIIRAVDRNIVLVEEITLGASQTSEGTQQLSASNEQVTSTIQQVAASTQELSELAMRLQQSVDRFRI